MDDAGKFVHSKTSVRISILNPLLVRLHTGRYVVVHQCQKFPVAFPGRAGHSDEFQSATFPKFLPHISALFATPCSNVDQL